MRSLLFAVLPAVLLFSGCASQDRYGALYELSAAPVSQATWQKMLGNYSGPVRSRVKTRFGSMGVKSEELSLSVRGTALHPQVFFRIRSNYSTAWTGSGSRFETFTNIPRLLYGVEPLVDIGTHAPNQLVIEVPKRIYIMEFKCPGSIEVDELGVHGWRGKGRLNRIPEYPCGR